MFRLENDWFMPFGARAGNLYIGRTPYGSRPVINITPGPFRGPRGRGKAAGWHPWIPYGVRYIYWLESAKRNRAVPGRLPTGPREDPLCNPPGLSRVVYGLPVWIKRRENWEKRLRHTGDRAGS